MGEVFLHFLFLFHAHNGHILLILEFFCSGFEAFQTVLKFSENRAKYKQFRIPMVRVHKSQLATLATLSFVILLQVSMHRTILCGVVDLLWFSPDPEKFANILQIFLSNRSKTLTLSCLFILYICLCVAVGSVCPFCRCQALTCWLGT